MDLGWDLIPSMKRPLVVTKSAAKHSRPSNRKMAEQKMCYGTVGWYQTWLNCASSNNFKLIPPDIFRLAADIYVGVFTLRQLLTIVWADDFDFSLIEKTNKALSINIYGPQNRFEWIGDRLSDVYAFLQHPSHIRDGVRYDNPLYLQNPTDPVDLHQTITHDGKELCSWTASHMRGLEISVGKMLCFQPATNSITCTDANYGDWANICKILNRIDRDNPRLLAYIINSLPKWAGEKALIQLRREIWAWDCEEILKKLRTRSGEAEFVKLLVEIGEDRSLKRYGSACPWR